MTSAMYESGMSGLYMNLDGWKGEARWDFQPLYIQFPSSVQHGSEIKSYTKKEAAKLATYAFNLAIDAVGLALNAAPKPTALTRSEVQKMFTVKASAQLRIYAQGWAKVQNTSSNHGNTPLTPVKWDYIGW